MHCAVKLLQSLADPNGRVALGIRGQGMRRIVLRRLFFTYCVCVTALLFGQERYKVITVSDGGTISGTVRWAGSVPRALDFPITKDPSICDPESKKTVDMERLLMGPQGGVANTVVHLKNISSGKALELPEQRRHLDQKRCRYIPHILLVPQNGTLDMRSSDPTLHTIHMDGAATFNLAFPFPDRVSARTVSTAGLSHLRCNGGHIWMNAEMMVVSHPYYAVTNETGHFQITDIPPGTYQLVAWHEGWTLAGTEQAYDVLTQHSVQRPVFTEPKTWEKPVTVGVNQTSTVDFVITNK